MAGRVCVYQSHSLHGTCHCVISACPHCFSIFLVLLKRWDVMVCKCFYIFKKWLKARYFHITGHLSFIDLHIVELGFLLFHIQLFALTMLQAFVISLLSVDNDSVEWLLYHNIVLTKCFASHWASGPFPFLPVMQGCAAVNHSECESVCVYSSVKLLVPFPLFRVGLVK